MSRNRHARAIAGAHSSTVVSVLSTSHLTRPTTSTASSPAHYSPATNSRRRESSGPHRPPIAGHAPASQQPRTPCCSAALYEIDRLSGVAEPSFATPENGRLCGVGNLVRPRQSRRATYHLAGWRRWRRSTFDGPILKRTDEEWARSIVTDDTGLALIEGLPSGKRQPNLVFAADRAAGSPLAGYREPRPWILGHWNEVETAALARSTQTNEAARCGARQAVAVSTRQGHRLRSPRLPTTAMPSAAAPKRVGSRRPCEGAST